MDPLCLYIKSLSDFPGLLQNLIFSYLFHILLDTDNFLLGHFSVVDVNEWTNQKYDFISVLNLLDRVHDPAQLLSNIQASLNPDGTVLLAIVLPYSPWVEEGK